MTRSRETQRSRAKKASVSTQDLVLRRLKEHAWIGAILATALGTVYLFLYCTANRVPMPLSLSELPTLLLAMALVGLFITFVLIGSMILPLAASLGFEDIGFWDLYLGRRPIRRTTPFPENEAKLAKLNPDLQTARRKKKKNRIKRGSKVFLATLGIPLVAITVAIFLIALTDGSGWGVIASIAAAITVGLSIGFGVRRYSRKADWARCSTFSGLVLVYSLFWATLTFSLVTKSLSAAIASLPSWGQVAVLAVVAIMLIAIVGFFLVARLGARKLEPKNYVALALIAAVFPIAVSPIGALISGAALNLLGIGGGIPMTLGFEKDSPELLREILGGEKEATGSKPLYLLLDMGSDIYVAFDRNQPARVIELQSKHIAIRLREDILQGNSKSSNGD